MDWASQFTKIKQRFKTSIVKITMQLPGDEQCREIICLALRKLAGWLQTISPNKVRPEIRDKVIQYQEELRTSLLLMKINYYYQVFFNPGIMGLDKHPHPTSCPGWMCLKKPILIPLRIEYFLPLRLR